METNMKEYQKRYREKNKDKIIEMQKKWREEHQDEIIEYHKKYQSENKDKIQKHHKKYYESCKNKKIMEKEKHIDNIIKQSKHNHEIKQYLLKKIMDNFFGDLEEEFVEWFSSNDMLR